MLHLPLHHQFAQLPARFYAKVQPTPVANPKLIKFNTSLALELGISDFNDENELAQVFSGNVLPVKANPIAAAYCGHQFGHLNPQLGDGRAILLGDCAGYDLQLKGSGPTPFSRNGDGRSPLGPVLREYLICEYLHALGVPTTRALAAVSSGEMVYRQQGPEPGAIFTRVAKSHIRVGNFQYFALRHDIEALQLLTKQVQARHYPQCTNIADMFAEVCWRQAQLIAHWMSIGFVHGVMNTDNILVSGEGIDYGPCAFLESYHPNRVFSSIDRHGRYAFGQQPAMTQWNLARLAEALLPLLADDEAQAIALAEQTLNEFVQRYHHDYDQKMAAKLGFQNATENTPALIQTALNWLQETQADFTLFWHRLADCLQQDNLYGLLDLTITQQSDTEDLLIAWLISWKAELLQHTTFEQAHQQMRTTNPAIIARNHRVAEAIQAAEQEDFSLFHQLLAALESPFAVRAEHQHLMHPARVHEQVTRTFCGT